MSFIVLVTLLDVGGLILILLAIKFAGSGLFEGEFVFLRGKCRLCVVTSLYVTGIRICVRGSSGVFVHCCMVCCACLVLSWKTHCQGEFSTSSSPVRCRLGIDSIELYAYQMQMVGIAVVIIGLTSDTLGEMLHGGDGPCFI
jgi:hypothetical protein